MPEVFAEIFEYLYTTKVTKSNIDFIVAFAPSGPQSVNSL